MAQRVTLAALLASTSLSGPQRVGASYLVHSASFSGFERISGAHLAISAGLAGPQRVGAAHLALATGLHSLPLLSGAWIVSVSSIHNAFWPNLLTNDDSQLYSLDSVIFTEPEFQPLDVPPAPEHNPYRPAIPESTVELGEEFNIYLRENQEILRQQHNLIQAGDSTFPWQLFATTHEEQQYTLGSIARFYHEDWGLIHARYVRFELTEDIKQFCTPVGLIKNRLTIDWAVTNQYDLSDPHLIVGFLTPYHLPKNGSYGWVIVDGLNILEIDNESSSAEIGESFSWSSSGKVSNAASGKILGRRIRQTPDDLKLYPGQVWIQIESLSIQSIVNELEAFLDNLTTQIETLQSDVALLQATAEVEETLNLIQQNLTLLTSRLENEERARQNADTALHSRINTLVTASQLGNAVSSLQNSIAILQSTLSTRIQTAQMRADEAWALANSLVNSELSNLQEQISSILSLLGALDERAKGKFPVVDGSIPPNLVYLDDGTLVYTETF